VSGAVTLSGPAAFATGGIGIGASGSIGGGISGGVGIGGGLDITATAGAAFGGLRAGVSSGTTVGLDASALLPGPTATVNANASAGFALGGMARASAGASLATNVGAAADLHGRISFGD
jgi:hypothetical protein